MIPFHLLKQVREARKLFEEKSLAMSKMWDTLLSYEKPLTERTKDLDAANQIFEGLIHKQKVLNSRKMELEKDFTEALAKAERARWGFWGTCLPFLRWLIPSTASLELSRFIDKWSIYEPGWP